MVFTKILSCRYYDTEDFSLISIIMTLNIMIHDTVIYCPALGHGLYIIQHSTHRWVVMTHAHVLTESTTYISCHP